MATYVLVAGAWLGGWAWQDVSGRLRAAGHEAHPVTLTGLGERAHLATRDVDLETHVTDVVNVMEYEDLSDVVLVGHSYGGVVVQGAADRSLERIATVVYLDTGPLAGGMSMLDFFPPDARTAVESVVNTSGDGWRLPFPGIDGLAQQASIAGLNSDARELMERRAAAQPFATYTQSLRLKHDQVAYPRRAIFCSDGGFTVQQVEAALVSNDPGMFGAFAGPGWEFDEIHTGHWSMLSEPEQLAAILDRYAREG
jgi:pimeloyl-ACP methyl ester carboxylesterase